jgi:hypothetical protein
MDEKSLIFGVSDAVEDLILALIKKKIKLDLDNDYYLNISPPPIDESEEYFGGSVISGIFVDLTEELIKIILGWLQTNKKFKNPKLKLIIDGNLLNLNIHDFYILLHIQKECSQKKKTISLE